MKNLVQKIKLFNSVKTPYDLIMLLFRVTASVQLKVVHGLKKIGFGTGIIESVPNPFKLPNDINYGFAVASNIIFPLFIILGWYTRLAAIPVLVVTFSGYFVVHWNDSLLESDIPFMYSITFLLIALLNPGKYSLDSYLNNCNI
jgi:putative oxidoreductase